MIEAESTTGRQEMADVFWVIGATRNKSGHEVEGAVMLSVPLPPPRRNDHRGRIAPRAQVADELHLKPHGVQALAGGGASQHVPAGGGSDEEADVGGPLW